MSAAELCRHLAWDSEFWGLRIARLADGRLDREGVDASMAWCRREGVDCLYFLADADDPRTIELAEENGFSLTDVRVTLEAEVAAAPPAETPPAAARNWRREDIPALKAIAASAYRGTRFYNDRHFQTESCNRLYATWIERSCEGYADAVLVAESGGRVAGYLSCHRGNGPNGRIGLVGIHPEAAGAGLGRSLVQASLQWFRQREIRKVGVATQGSNCKAQRLYQRCGFLTQSVQLWYHRWFQPAERESKQ